MRAAAGRERSRFVSLPIDAPKREFVITPFGHENLGVIGCIKAVPNESRRLGCDAVVPPRLGQDPP